MAGLEDRDLALEVVPVRWMQESDVVTAARPVTDMKRSRIKIPIIEIMRTANQEINEGVEALLQHARVQGEPPSYRVTRELEKVRSELLES